MSRHGIPHSCPSIDKAIQELDRAKDELKAVLKGLGDLDVPVADLIWSADYALDRIGDAVDHFEEARNINANLRGKLEEALERVDELEDEMAQEVAA